MKLIQKIFLQIQKKFVYGVNKIDNYIKKLKKMDMQILFAIKKRSGKDIKNSFSINQELPKLTLNYYNLAIYSF